MNQDKLQGLELRSCVTDDGKLVLSLEHVDASAPGPDEVVVQVQAAPINPSDLGLLLGFVTPDTLHPTGTPDHPQLTCQLPPGVLQGMAARVGQSLPVGNEGAGTVIRAGALASALLGRTVGMAGGGMYTQYRRLPARDCLPLPPGATAAEGASLFVNPLTALAMVETMRAEGHSALVHTAAASNLGQMLNRICLSDGVPLVNIVRSEEQAALLRDQGARHVLDSTQPEFAASLTDALAESRATIAFDAIGGGPLANTILHAMEAAANRGQATYSRYGSNIFKQVYIYGMLDTGPSQLDRLYGFAWSVSGFLLTPFLMKLGAEGIGRLRARVLAEMNTTFTSHYTHTISLREALDPAVVAAYARKATGQKYLIDPSK